MKFIYFPFTHLSRSSYQAISAFFRKITVFQVDAPPPSPVMKSLLEAGFLEGVLPVIGHEKAIRDRIASFKAWGETLDDKSRSAFKTGFEEAPFFTETASSRIRAELKESLVSEKEALHKNPEKKMTEEERLVWAGTILCLAGEWDTKREEMEEDLKHYRDMEKRLFENVRDRLSDDLTDSDPLPETKAPALSKEYKLEERLRAWSLFLSYYQEETGIFVTDRKEVVDSLQEFSSLGERIFRVGPVPEGPASGEEPGLFYSAIETWLVHLAQGEAVESDDIPAPSSGQAISDGKRRIYLDVYQARRLPPSQFFKKAGRRSGTGDDHAPERPESINTVVCLISGND